VGMDGGMGWRYVEVLEDRQEEIRVCRKGRGRRICLRPETAWASLENQPLITSLLDLTIYIYTVAMRERQTHHRVWYHSRSISPQAPILQSSER
jgi:hypothetical protein